MKAAVIEVLRASGSVFLFVASRLALPLIVLAAFAGIVALCITVSRAVHGVFRHATASHSSPDRPGPPSGHAV